MRLFKRVGLLAAVLAVGVVAYFASTGSHESAQSEQAIAAKRIAGEKPSKADANSEKGATVAKSATKKGYVLKRTGAAAKADDGKNMVVASDPGRLISPSESIANAGLPVPGDSNMIEKPWSKKNQEWPDPRRGTAEGTVIDYRVSQLSPTEKGGEFGERHEWLIEPTEGYTYHVEEDYYPNGAGEGQLVASCQYVANQVMLKVPAEVPFEDFRSAMQKVGVIVKDPLMEVEKGAKLVAVKVPEITFSAVSELQDAIRKYDPGLKPEKDFVNTVGVVPNDTYYSSLWAMPKIKAPEAWNIRTTADNSVRIAVVDTGVYYTHEDLVDNVEGTGFRSIGGDTNGTALDDNGHGTHCAGTIAGKGNNGKGVAGVAWSAIIRPYKFLNGSGSGCNSDAIACFAQIRRDKGASQKWIVSCSWGGSGYDSSLESAISALRSDGIIVVCAAGNNGTNNDSTPHYPSSYTCNNIVAVASTGSSDALSSFSCYGRTSVDIAAPGEGIYSTYINGGSTSTYASLSGTSMATPHVSGALALIWSQFPTENYSQIIQRLYNGGDTVAALNGKCTTGKRINVSNSLQGATLPAPSPVTASQGAFEDRIFVEWPAVTGATHYELSYATSATGAKTVLQSWGTATSFTHSSLAANVTYYYFVRAAANASGARASAYSAAVSGYTQAQVRDGWDPGDDTAGGSTVLTPTDTPYSHGSHNLSSCDSYDWFKIDMTAGYTYYFSTTDNAHETYGTLDTYGELYDASTTNRVAYNDDCGGSWNFSFSYTPSADATYYLRVRAYSVGSTGQYTLNYSYSRNGDEWDPEDDTKFGATEIEPTATEQRHGEHSMSLTDTNDWFKITMDTRHAYTFVSESETDMIATLYKGDGTQVAYNDDGNGYPNFRLVYTPTAPGDYFLKVETWARPRVGTYNLLYSSEEVTRTYNIGYVPKADWQGRSLFVSKTGGNHPEPCSVFAPTDTIYVCYSWQETSNPQLAIIESVTNKLSLVNGSGRETWWANNWWPQGLSIGQLGYSVIQIGNPGRGSYTLKVDLNQNYDGVHSVNQYSYDGNHDEFTFTVVNPAPTLDSIRIEGSDSVASGATAQYTCMATFSDGTTQSVTPDWTTSDTDVAQISEAGLLTAHSVVADTPVTVYASYEHENANGVSTNMTAWKSVTVTYVAPVKTAPFPAPTIRNPAPPWAIHGPVRINGTPAEQGDVLAAYVGDECRGTGVVDENGNVAMGVYLDNVDEMIRFKVWDRSSGDEGEVLNVMQAIRRSLFAADHYVWTPEDEPPAEFDACSRDPFGDPVISPSMPTILYAKATINGRPASSGDLLVAIDKDTDEVVGKQVLRYRSNGAGGSLVPTNETGTAYCMMVMYLGHERTNLVYRVWDVSEDMICRTRRHYRMTAKPGDVIAKDQQRNPVYQPIDTTDDTIVEIELQPGWTPISLSVMPSNAAPWRVFEEVSNRIEFINGPDRRNGSEIAGFYGNWDPFTSGSVDLTRMGIGLGYWVLIDPNSDPISIDIEGAGDPSTTLHLKSEWNLIGYTLPRGGRIVDVLKGALGSGRITRIMYGSAVYPDGNLTVLEPGMAYWMYSASDTNFQYNAAGMMNLTACAEASNDQHDCGGFGRDDEGITYDLDKFAVENATILENVTVTLFGKPARMGDCIAVYGTGDKSTNCYAKAKVGDSGTVSMAVFAKAGDKLTFKVWNSVGGEIFDCDGDFTAEPGATKTGLTANATAETTPTYTVTFDLGDFADRTGGGELEQTVLFGENAVFPTIEAKEGFTFRFWEYTSVDDIRGNVTVHAYFNGVISFNVNGGSGRMDPVSVSGGVPVVLPACTFTREGRTFGGWATNAVGKAVYDDCAVIPAAEAEQIPVLYAVWNGSIELDANGGEGEMDPVAVKGGEDVVLPACTFTFTNHTFVGWAVTKDGAVAYSNQTTIAAADAGSITVLYAVWQAGDEPEPVPVEKPELIKDPTKGDVKDNIAYTGWLSDKNGVKASFSVKISKAKNGKAKATVTVQPVSGKKYPLKGTIDMATGKGEGDLEGLEFGASGVTGKIDDLSVTGAVGAGKKGDSVLAKLDSFKKKVFAVAFDAPNGFESKSTASMTLTFSTKGKVKVAGTLADGSKVSLSCQATLGDKLIAVPVVYAKKGISFVVWIDADASSPKAKAVSELPEKWTALKVGSAGGVKTGEHVFSVVPKDVKAVVSDVFDKLLPEAEKFTVNDKKKFVFDKACKIDKTTGEAQGDKKNPAAVKITYKDAAGTLKGSFGVWAPVKNKAKKTSVTVTGVVIDGVGYGTGVIKKKGSFPINIK